MRPPWRRPDPRGLATVTERAERPGKPQPGLKPEFSLRLKPGFSLRMVRQLALEPEPGRPPPRHGRRPRPPGAGGRGPAARQRARPAVAQPGLQPGTAPAGVPGAQ